jgi:UDP-N-acetylglucosamine 1-carboxyvinyltransferase
VSIANFYLDYPLDKYTDYDIFWIMFDETTPLSPETIGSFVRQIRENRNMSQQELGLLLGTSQPAVARMESGQQNFSTEMLSRISSSLHHKIVALKTSMDFEIEGGRKLSGSIDTNCSKNGAMGLLCASLLNKGKTTLHGIPRIEEVNRIIEVLESINVKVSWVGKNTLEVFHGGDIRLEEINVEAANKTRSIVMFIGSLIHHFDSFRLPQAQGCHLGKRSIIAHIYGLEELGLKIKVNADHYAISTKKLKPETVVMYESGDTAVENVIIAASLIPGHTQIRFASPNYMVQEVCFFLQKCGVKIDGVGTNILDIYGIKELNQDVTYHNSEDPIEAMMFLSAAITTDSEITIRRVPIDFLELELYKLEKMGFKYKQSRGYKSKNGHTNLVDITTLPSKLKALDEKLYGRPFPGVNIDNLPFFVPICAKAEGTTLIHDWVFENRAIYYMELVRLGAKMILADPHRVYVEGPVKFKAAQVVCPPALRPAMIILIGMLAAEGTSVLRNVYSINRGYEEIAMRLNSLGANIKVVE